MKHPTREEWMAFVYEELSESESKPLQEHLQGCAECERSVGRWRGTMGALDGWKISQARPRILAPWVRWAAAAAVLLVVGVLIGQMSAQRSFKNEMAAESARTREIITQFAKAVAENRVRDQEAYLATLRELETQRAGEMKAMREDLETVAANTQAQLGRLVSFSGQ